MKLLAIISSLFILAVSIRAQDPAPTQDPTAPEEPTLQVQAAAKGVALVWTESEGASQYLITIQSVGGLGEQPLTQLTSKKEAIMFGLVPGTQYSVDIDLTDENGTVVYQGYLHDTFKTLLPQVENLRVIYYGQDSIQLEWSERNDSTGYGVVVKDDDLILLHPGVEVTGNRATISGLKPITYYNIYVIEFSAHGKGEPAHIHARTDGKGVKVDLWSSDGVVHGGVAIVYRPMKVPIGAYYMKINFGCPLLSVDVWNAEVSEAHTDLTTGMVVVVQKKLWEKEKYFIGISFYPKPWQVGYDYCEITNTSVTALFGDDAEIAAEVPFVPTSNEEIPVYVYEWATKPKKVVYGGIIKILLDQKFNNTWAQNPTHPKPAEGHFVIAVDSGAGCDGGLIIHEPWSMTQKSKDNMPGATAQMSYFVQKGKDWNSNEPGFLYGYDPKICKDRKDIAVNVMIGGQFVDAVFLAPDITDYNSHY